MNLSWLWPFSWKAERDELRRRLAHAHYESQLLYSRLVDAEEQLSRTSEREARVVADSFRPSAKVWQEKDRGHFVIDCRLDQLGYRYVLPDRHLVSVAGLRPFADNFGRRIGMAFSDLIVAEFKKKGILPDDRMDVSNDRLENDP